MGKLAAIYKEARNEDTSKVELMFPVVAKSLWLHRPSFDEEQYIEDRRKGLEGSDEYEYSFGAVVLKNLCDDPNLREEDEHELAKDIRTMESPDRKAILNMWTILIGSMPKTMRELFMSNPDLFRVPKPKQTTTG